MTGGRRGRPRGLVYVVPGAIALAICGYLAGGALAWDRLSRVDACGAPADNTPAAFEVAGVDVAPYLTDRYETVSLPSRESGITIAGWYEPVEGAVAEAPAVVLVHGLRSCRRAGIPLLAAGMLRRAGFAMLLIDLRDHGDSSREDGRFAGGTEEYRDVLGAWDWLVARGHEPARIGLLGFSLGAATAMIAAGEEPRVAAIWEDSGFGDIEVASRDELSRNGYPTVIAPAAILVARLLAGDDLTSPSPISAIGRLGHRPIFITHGDADTRMSPRHAAILADAVRAGGGSVEPWIVPGAEHVQAITLVPDEYERRLVAFFRASLARPG